MLILAIVVEQFFSQVSVLVGRLKSGERRGDGVEFGRVAKALKVPVPR